jgi:hypothetical protein
MVRSDPAIGAALQGKCHCFRVRKLSHTSSQFVRADIFSQAPFGHIFNSNSQRFKNDPTACGPTVGPTSYTLSSKERMQSPAIPRALRKQLYEGMSDPDISTDFKYKHDKGLQEWLKSAQSFARAAREPAVSCKALPVAEYKYNG